MKDIRINTSIPHTMTQEGLRFLGELARHVPENGVIVEVGPLFGSSTWVLAKNAHPSVTVYSIDTWEPAEWIDKVVAKKFPKARKFSREAFEYYVRDCPNVKPVQGWSPDVVADTWDRKIDLFFDDASHGNPGFINNLEFFEPFVKPGCVMCGDDYASGCPDIITETNRLARRWNQRINVIGRVWALRKPLDPSAPDPVTVYGGLTPHKGPFPVLITHNASGVCTSDYPSSWTGRLHRYDPIFRFTLAWGGRRIPRLEILARCKGMDGMVSPWRRMGEYVETDKPWVPIAEVRFRLAGRDADKYTLRYQAGWCYPRIGRKVGAHNSRFFHADSWTGMPATGAPLPINALRVKLEERRP